MKLEIHTTAAVSFNSRAEEILLLLAPYSEPPTQTAFRPDTYVEHKITDKDVIGQMKRGLIDFRGDEVAKFFDSGGKTLGFVGEAYNKFRKLCEGIQSLPSAFPLHKSFIC